MDTPTQPELCARDHFARGFHITTHSPEVECAGCQPAHASHGTLCGPCYGRILWALGETPAIAAHIMGQIPKGITHAPSERVSGGGYRTPSPLSEMALEDCNDLYAQLMSWMISHTRDLRTRPPVTALGYRRKDTDAEGFPSWARPADAFDLVTCLVEWYRSHAEQVATLPAAAVWHDDLIEIVTTLRGRYGLREERPRPASARACPVCGEQAVRAHWYGEDVDVVCDFCQHVVPPNAAALYVLELAAA